MNLHNITSQIFIPDGVSVPQALQRTTQLAIAAHQDDIEIMAAAPILACYRQSEQWFAGVVVGDGRGSPRAGLYLDYDDEQMRQVRFAEQKKAASVGEYSAVILLDYPSRAIQSGSNAPLVDDLVEILQLTEPSEVYTHNLADKHATHVAVALRVVSAIRKLPLEIRPHRLFGCEVWRDLDWMADDQKVAMDVSGRESLQAALLGVFDSQITGGKRYDLATFGRRRANATFSASHAVDTTTGLSFAMDLTPLITDDDLDPGQFVQAQIARFAADVATTINRLK